MLEWKEDDIIDEARKLMADGFTTFFPAVNEVTEEIFGHFGGGDYYWFRFSVGNVKCGDLLDFIKGHEWSIGWRKRFEGGPAGLFISLRDEGSAIAFKERFDIEWETPLDDHEERKRTEEFLKEEFRSGLNEMVEKVLDSKGDLTDEQRERLREEVEEELTDKFENGLDDEKIKEYYDLTHA
jgi:hypothetical protein